MGLPDELADWLRDATRVVVAGVGNPLRRDDGVGVHLVRALEGRVPPTVRLIECETVPESFITPIEEFEPTHIVFVDAAVMGLAPGEARLIRPEETIGSSISTHSLPLYLTTEYLKESLDVKVVVLAIQPGDTSFGEEMTPELVRSVSRIASVLVGLLSGVR